MVMQQTKIGPLDMVSSTELNAAIHSHLGSHETRLEMQRLSGIKVMKLPVVDVVASSATFTLNEPSGQVQVGPDSGFIWQLRRVIIASSLANDLAKFALYSGSDTSAQARQLLEGGTQYPQITLNNLALGTSGTAVYNNNPYPVLVTVSGGTVSAIAVGSVTTGATSGTFYVPAGSTITVTYSVAPTQTTAQVPGNQPYSGLPVDVSYYPSQRGAWLFPGEQLYAIMAGATVGTSYTLSGIAVEVPFQMQGKIAA